MKRSKVNELLIPANFVRWAESKTGTYHYGDNLGCAVAQYFKAHGALKVSAAGSYVVVDDKAYELGIIGSLAMGRIDQEDIRFRSFAGIVKHARSINLQF